MPLPSMYVCIGRSTEHWTGRKYVRERGSDLVRVEKVWHKAQLPLWHWSSRIVVYTVSTAQWAHVLHKDTNE